MNCKETGGLICARKKHLPMRDVQFIYQNDTFTAPPFFVLPSELLEYIRLFSAPCIMAVSIHKGSALAVTESGEVCAWGLNKYGQLGIRIDHTAGWASNAKWVPTIVPRDQITGPVKQIACGRRNSAFVDDEGHLFLSGANTAQFFAGSDTPQLIDPAHFVDANNENSSVKMAAIGCEHIAVVTEDGRLFTWGSNAGHTHVNPGHFFFANLNQVAHVPTLVANIPPVAMVACGYNSTIALTEHGHVLRWDSHMRLDDLNPDLLNVSVDEFGNTRSLRDLGDTFVYVSAGDKHAAAVTEQGRVYTWGSDDMGQCGRDAQWPAGNLVQQHLRFDNDPEDAVPITDPDDGRPVPIRMVSCGEKHTLAVSKNGELWACGLNDETQCGIQQAAVDAFEQPPIRSFQRVTNVTGRIVFAAAGSDCSFALTSEGQLWSWGNTEHGRRGIRDGTFIEHEENLPQVITTVCRLRADDTEEYQPIKRIGRFKPFPPSLLWEFAKKFPFGFNEHRKNSEKYKKTPISKAKFTEDTLRQIWESAFKRLDNKQEQLLLAGWRGTRGRQHPGV